MIGISRTNIVQKQVLEERLASLNNEYVVVNRQMNNERDDRSRLLLKNQADELLKQSKQAEEELEQLEASENNFNKIYLDVKNILSEIDFKQAINIVESVTNQFGRDGGSALFMLENSYSMSGYLLLYKIREKLERKTRNFRHIQIEFSSGSSSDEYGLLERLAGYLNFPEKSISSVREYSQQIIKKICQSLQSGTVVFIEINKWNYLHQPEIIIPWFVDNFWIPLIQESKILVQQKELRRVQIVTIIDSEKRLSLECNQLPYYCYLDNFDSQKILKLPLSSWTQEDIQEWLEQYAGLPAPKIDTITEDIYSKTMDGIPFMVCHALEEALKQKYYS